MAIAPWLQPTNYLQAMSSGAELGLNARRQDQAQFEAAQALRQRQSEMAQQLMTRQQEAAQQQQGAAQALRAHQEELGASLQERQSEAAVRAAEMSAQLAQQAGYHEEAQRAQSAAQALREKHEGFLEDQKKTQAARGQIIHESGDGIYKVGPDGAVTALQKFDKISPFDLADYKEMAAKKRQLNTALSKATSEEDKNGIKAQLAALDSQLSSIQGKYAKSQPGVDAADDGEMTADDSGANPGEDLITSLRSASSGGTNATPLSAGPALSAPPAAPVATPAPDLAAMAPASSSPPTPQSQEEFDALPEGALFINPSTGETLRKKAS